MIEPAHQRRVLADEPSGGADVVFGGVDSAEPAEGEPELAEAAKLGRDVLLAELADGGVGAGAVEAAVLVDVKHFVSSHVVYLLGVCRG